MYEFLKPIYLNTEGIYEVGRRVPKDEITKAEAIIGKRLPPSFVQWLLEMGDDCYLFNGNLRIYPLLSDQGNVPSIVDQLSNLNNANWGLDRSLIIFGDNGNNEFWAFYTGYMVNGEYPILEIGTIFSSEMKDYKLWNTSFKKFITIQTLYWPYLLEQELAPTNSSQILKEIQSIIEPQIEVNYEDIYKQSSSIQEIREALESKFWHTRYNL